MKISCAKCVFAKKEESKQIGCALGRHEKLGVDEISEGGDFILSRFCTTYRPEQWLQDLSLSESVDIEKTVLTEIQPRIGFFLILDHENTDHSLDDLRKTLEDLKAQEIQPRYVIVINDKVEYNELIHSMLYDYFHENGPDTTSFHIVQLIEKPKLLASVIDESFGHAKNGWAYVCHAGENIDTDLIKKVHHRVNIELKKLVVVEPYNDKLDGLLFQTALFKFLNGNRVKVFQDENVDSRTFMEKVKDVASKSDKETYITWSEFNES